MTEFMATHLVAEGYLSETDDNFALTEKGNLARNKIETESFVVV